MTHTLLGEVKVETYTGKLNGKEVNWQIAYDKEGRVWADAINFKDGKISSYGTQTEVIDSGCLTNKPIEYSSQADKIPKGMKKAGFVKTENGTNYYDDITPLLDQMEFVQAFRKARGVYRTGSAALKAA